MRFAEDKSSYFLNKLKQILEKTTVLNFTTELEIDKKKSLSLMYLPIPTIITNSLHFHIKNLPATIPPLLNDYSECPQKYKIAIIKKLIHRAFYISSKTHILQRTYKHKTNPF